MGKKHIVMAVTNDLVTDQRVGRSCKALIEAGYEVTVVARSQAKEWCGAKVRGLNLWNKKGPGFYAEYNLRLFWKLLWMPCDMIWANDTDTLLACGWVARLRGKKLWMDVHELFPEVPELVGRNKVKRVWEWIERKWMPRIDGGCTVCESIAEYYKSLYGVDLRVVRNVPTHRDYGESYAKSGKMLLYQGAVNDGRGVDWMIEAMEYLKGYELMIAGVGDEYEKMQQLAASKPWHEQIKFKGRLTPDALFELSKQADLGLVLLANKGLSYYYSLPNRIGDFVQAKVPVLATNFPEIRRIVDRYGVGSLVDGHDPKMLAQKVEETIKCWQQMSEQEREKRFDAAYKDLNWEKEKKVMLEGVNNIFNIL